MADEPLCKSLIAGDPSRRFERRSSVYVVGLVIVAAIVSWLVDTVATSLTSAYVVPALQRNRRASTSPASGRDYERGLAFASFVRSALGALAVFATCFYYAENNLPVWPAWAVFAAFFAVFHLPRLIAASARLTGLRRPAV
jgi:Na+/H+ antiporter NhaD/arsenite permease-like protein